jgi:peptidoglycan/xylan/chitin deacetylase (PgdA/CDA1 family)
MLHRFADQGRGNPGHDPAVLRANLAELRRSGRELVSVDEIIRRALQNDFRGSAPVAFTVDDGYADFATVGSAVFAEFDCPVTVFLVSGVLDGDGWYWWDRISAALEQTTRQDVTLTVSGRTRRFAWATAEERSRVEVDLMEALKVVPETERLYLLDLLAAELAVSLPSRPPELYAPMTWEQVRACGARGATFGAHTVTHPILSQLSDDAARREIRTSWERLRQETSATTDVFCYPNGGPGDFSDRETALLSELGFGSAVTTLSDHVMAPRQGCPADARYRIPRFSYPDDTADFAQITSGIERAKITLRRMKPR